MNISFTRGRVTYADTFWYGWLAGYYCPRVYLCKSLIVAQATMDYFIEQGLADAGLVIGYDRRFLSRRFAERVAEIAAGNGLRVRLTDRYTPTPAVSWAVHESAAGGGIMITASHNPPEYNGFKIKEYFGGSARPSTTRVVEEIVAKNIANGRKVLEMPLAEALEGGHVQLFDAGESYRRQLSRFVDLERIRAAAIPLAVIPMIVPVAVSGLGRFLERLSPTAKRTPRPLASRLSRHLKIGRNRPLRRRKTSGQWDWLWTVMRIGSARLMRRESFSPRT